ncbi:MFS transporter [Nocardia sp. NPDC127579]|uniref:MFS transporter n=1 Tax=Nocardia sp. NPDC127579 TaxID=3345402 RepID=UPI00363341D5
MIAVRVAVAQPAVRPAPQLLAVVLVSSFDRFAVSSMLVLIAVAQRVPLSSVVVLAGGYFLAYGLSQPLWGLLSDRYGRVRVLRVALLGAAVAGTVSALAPTLSVLIGARVVAGACFGAVLPTSITYVGDTVDSGNRQRTLSDIIAVTAVGTALATGLAGVTAELLDWRVVFAGPALAALAGAYAVGRLPEPARPPVVSPRAQLGSVLRNRWAVLVFALACTEGAVLLGVMTFLATGLQAHGSSAAIAGSATAAYGLGVLGLSRLVRILTRRLPVTALMGIGGAQMCLGYVVAALRVDPLTVTVTALLLGGGWAFLHSSLQTWSTEVDPAARGTVVSLFAGALFLGSAAATAIAAPAAQYGHYTVLFAGAALLTVPLTVLSVLGRRRWQRRNQGECGVVS